MQARQGWKVSPTSSDLALEIKRKTEQENRKWLLLSIQYFFSFLSSPVSKQGYIDHPRGPCIQKVTSFITSSIGFSGFGSHNDMKVTGITQKDKVLVASVPFSFQQPR